MFFFIKNVFLHHSSFKSAAAVGSSGSHSLQRSAKLVPDKVKFNSTKPTGYVTAVKELFATRQKPVNLFFPEDDADKADKAVRFNVIMRDEDRISRRRNNRTRTASESRSSSSRPKRHTTGTFLNR